MKSNGNGGFIPGAGRRRMDRSSAHQFRRDRDPEHQMMDGPGITGIMDRHGESVIVHLDFTTKSLPLLKLNLDLDPNYVG